MSLENAAKHLAAHGRGPDSQLVHMSNREVAGLQSLAKAHGGSLTVNPKTGLPEAGFLDSILPTVIGGAAMYFSGGAINPMTVGLLTGGLQAARTGSLEKGLMAGIGAYGGAGLIGGVMGTGAAEIGKQAATEATKNAINPADAAAWGSEDTIGKAGLSQAQMQQQVADKMAGASNWDKLSTGITSGNVTANMGGMGNVAKMGLAAAAPALAQPTTQPPQIQSDSKMPQRLVYDTGRPTDAQGQTYTPMPDVPSYESGMGSNFGRERNYFPNAGYRKITDEEAKSLRGYAAGGYMGGGPVEQMSNANAVGANTGFPQADVAGHAFATPWQTPISRNVVTGATDTNVDQVTGEQKLAHGGLSDLGAFSDGGRLLKGPGDGVSDSIPAVIGNKRPARLADGEFVVPARIVSELGNGSTEAGARKLYAMLDRVQAARKKSIGKGKVAKNSKADKFLPA